MGTFKSTKTFFASPEIIPAIVKDITGTFTNEGYQVQAQDLISGGYDISITKGNMFKAVLGMKTALKVHIYPANEQIRVDAGSRDFRTTGGSDFDFYVFVLAGIDYPDFRDDCPGKNGR